MEKMEHRLESDEYYESLLQDHCLRIDSGRSKADYFREQDQLSRTSFNGNFISVGDEIIVVYGRHLRNSVVTEIIPYHERWYERIKVKGLKSGISSNFCVKV